MIWISEWLTLGLAFTASMNRQPRAPQHVARPYPFPSCCSLIVKTLFNQGKGIYRTLARGSFLAHRSRYSLLRQRLTSIGRWGHGAAPDKRFAERRTKLLTEQTDGVLIV